MNEITWKSTVYDKDGNVLTSADRVNALGEERIYYMKDPNTLDNIRAVIQFVEPGIWVRKQ